MFVVAAYSSKQKSTSPQSRNRYINHANIAYKHLLNEFWVCEVNSGWYKNMLEELFSWSSRDISSQWQTHYWEPPIYLQLHSIAVTYCLSWNCRLYNDHHLLFSKCGTAEKVIRSSNWLLPMMEEIESVWEHPIGGNRLRPQHKSTGNPISIPIFQVNKLQLVH